MNLAPYKKMYPHGDGSRRRQHCHLRPQSDVFECDPFKVHSFNFHYAERPDAIPLHAIQNRPHKSRNDDKRFETFYYNHGFNWDRHEREHYNSNSSKFHEGRRRKFLHDHSNSGGLVSNRYCPISHRVCNISSSVSVNHNQSENQEHPSNKHRYNPDPLYPAYPRKLFDTHKSLQSSSNNSPLLKSVCNRVGGEVRNASSRTSLGVSVVGSAIRLHGALGNRNTSIEMRRSDSVCNLNERRGSSNNLMERRSSACNLDERRRSACNLNERRSSSQSIGMQKDSKNGSLSRSSSRKSITIHRVQPKSRTGSFCNININIKGLEEQNKDGNVTIEIETDLDSSEGKRNILVNTNNNSNNNNRGSQHHLQQTNSRQNLNLGLKNSRSFVIDKRLSKFAIRDQLYNGRERLLPAENRVAQDGKRRERVVTRRGSKERVPADVAWQPNNLNICRRDDVDGNEQNAHMHRLGERFNNNFNDLRKSQQKLVNNSSEDNLRTIFKLNNKNVNINNNNDTNELTTLRLPRQLFCNNERTLRDNSPMNMNIYRLPRV